MLCSELEPGRLHQRLDTQTDGRSRRLGEGGPGGEEGGGSGAVVLFMLEYHGVMCETCLGHVRG